MKQFRIGVIGASGHWPYAKKQMAQHGVVGIAPGYPGENMAGLQKALEADGVVVVLYEDYRELLDSINVAVVNTRLDLNAEITMDCLRRDIYVFEEKPLAITMEQLQRLREAQDASKAFVTAMFGIRYESWFRTVKEAVRDIGAIRLLNGQKSYKLGRRDASYKKMETFGGIIPWVAIHAIDWVHDLAGVDFIDVQALTNNEYNQDHGDLEMTSLCLFQMDQGIIASVSADFFRPQGAPTHDDDRVRVVGTKGVVEYKQGTVQKIDAEGVTDLKMLPEEDVFELMLRRIQGEDVGVTPEESFYMTEVALRARDNALSKR